MGLIHDQEGIELAKLDAARRECIVNIRDLVAGHVEDGIIDLTASIDVDDENRKPVVTVPFDEAVKVKLPIRH